MTSKTISFDTKFWSFQKGGGWYVNSKETHPENSRIIEFLKCKPFNRKREGTKSNGIEIPVQ